MLTIHLKDLRFRAYHGAHKEESILGNDFIVNLHIHYLPVLPVIHELGQAVNYETVFELVRHRMAQTTPLMETVAMDICHAVMHQFSQVHAVFVSIQKTNPPIPSLEGSVVVSYQLSREPEEID